MATTVEQLRQVVALVRSWGYTVTLEPGWETRCGRASWTPCNAEYAVEHWTASPNTPTAYLRDGDPVRKLTVLCNVQFRRDGTGHLIAGGYANHAGYVDALTPTRAKRPPMDADITPGADSTTYSANRYAIGAEGNAGPGAPYTSAQHAFADAWWAACAIVFGWSRTAPPILGHKETTRRKPGDPSHSMAERRRRVATIIATKTAPTGDSDMTPDQSHQLFRVWQIAENLDGQINGDAPLLPQRIEAAVDAAVTKATAAILAAIAGIALPGGSAEQLQEAVRGALSGLTLRVDPPTT